MTAKTDLCCFILPIEMAKSWFYKYDNWQKYITQLAQEQNESLISLINEKVFEKLDVILRNYLDYLKQKLDTNIIITSHQDIARDLYISRESVSRALKKMENKGWLKLGRNKILLN